MFTGTCVPSEQHEIGHAIAQTDMEIQISTIFLLHSASIADLTEKLSQPYSKPSGSYRAVYVEASAAAVETHGDAGRAHPHA